MESSVYIVCDFNIQNHPNAENALYYAKIAREIGYKVTVIGVNSKSANVHGYEDSGISFINIGINNDYKLPYRLYVKYERYLKEFRKVFQCANDIKFVIYLGDYAGIAYREIQSQAKQKSFKIIFQMCEWYDLTRIYSDAMGIKEYIHQTIRLIMVEISRNWIFNHADGCIAISTELADKYRQRGLVCLKMPNLLEISLDKPCVNESGKLLLGYFGTPGMHNSKDALDIMIKGIGLLSQEDLEKLEVHFYGIDNNKLTENYDIPPNVVKYLSKYIVFHGRIDKTAVKKYLSVCDYTILLRRSTYSINCGLSSKMCESLSQGVPLICNITSDMGEYIIDGYNGIVCEDCSPMSFAESLKKVLSLTKEERYLHKIHALYIGKEKIDYRSWITNMRSFLVKWGDCK